MSSKDGTKTQSRQARLLWVDLTVAVQDAELVASLPPAFQVTLSRSRDEVLELCESGAVDMMCFDFDYPDRASLRFVQEIKLNFPSIPLVMLTLQHSESLAVWCLRTRIWDYLVKPISTEELSRSFGGLVQVTLDSARQKRRQVRMPSRDLPQDANVPKRAAADILLAPAVAYIQKNFRDQIKAEEVAKTCNLSVTQFSRQFKAAFNVGFKEYLVNCRLREARRMLESPNASITDVCYAVGFNDTSYFTKLFRRHFMVTPSEVLGTPVKAVVGY